MSSRRGTSNSNTRGSLYDRRRRREWLIEQVGIRRKSDGKKTLVRCAHCPKLMRAHGRKDRAGNLRFTWEVDRIICGHAGGKYVRGNVQVSCRGCNQTRCATRDCRFGAAHIVGSRYRAMQVAA